MVKLTAELIEQAAQYTNAVRDRELDLRGEAPGSPPSPIARRAATGPCKLGPVPRHLPLLLGRPTTPA